MSIGRDIYKIYKSENKKTRIWRRNKITKIEALKNVQYRIEKYYSKDNYMQISSNDLIKRYEKINYKLQNETSIFMSILYGILFGLGLTFSKLNNSNILEYILSMILPIAFIVFFYYGCGYFIFRITNFNELGLFVLQYERDLIVSKLKNEHNFDIKYIERPDAGTHEKVKVKKVRRNL